MIILANAPVVMFVKQIRSSDHLLYVTSIIFFGRCACSEAHQVQSPLNYAILLAVMRWWGGFVVMTHDAEISPLRFLVTTISSASDGGKQHVLLLDWKEVYLCTMQLCYSVCHDFITVVFY